MTIKRSLTAVACTAILTVAAACRPEFNRRPEWKRQVQDEGGRQTGSAREAGNVMVQLRLGTFAGFFYEVRSFDGGGLEASFYDSAQQRYDAVWYMQPGRHTLRLESPFGFVRSIPVDVSTDTTIAVEEDGDRLSPEELGAAMRSGMEVTVFSTWSGCAGATHEMMSITPGRNGNRFRCTLTTFRRQSADSAGQDVIIRKTASRRVDSDSGIVRFLCRTLRSMNAARAAASKSETDCWSTAQMETVIRCATRQAHFTSQGICEMDWTANIIERYFPRKNR